MTDFITRLTELAGADIAAQLVAEFVGQTANTETRRRSLANYLAQGDAVSFGLDDFVEQAIEDGFRAEMKRLMAGAMTVRLDGQPEWLATAQQLLSQRQLALAWHASQKTASGSPTPPASAA